MRKHGVVVGHYDMIINHSISVSRSDFQLIFHWNKLLIQALNRARVTLRFASKPRQLLMESRDIHCRKIGGLGSTATGTATSTWRRQGSSNHCIHPTSK
jgi:hypothetical protein